MKAPQGGLRYYFIILQSILPRVKKRNSLSFCEKTMNFRENRPAALAAGRVL